MKWPTHEHHPIPQPKQGRGLSNFRILGSSSSCIRVYLPLQSLQSQYSPEAVYVNQMKISFSKQ